jgi:hypothetical protein
VAGCESPSILQAYYNVSNVVRALTITLINLFTYRPTVCLSILATYCFSQATHHRKNGKYKKCFPWTDNPCKVSKFLY